MRWALVLISSAIYVLVFFPLYSVRGIGILALSAVPVIIAGWLFGLRAGIVAGVLIFPLNTLLMNLVGEPGWDAVFRHGGGIGSVAAVLVGAIIGQLHDLSSKLRCELAKHKRTEKALRESEERFRIVTEGSLAGVYIIQDGNFVYVNPTLAHLFGYGPDEMIGHMGPLDVTHPDSRDRVIETTHARLSGEVEAVQYAFVGLRKNGTMVHCEVLGRRVDYRDRPAIIGTLLDITERMRIQEELVKAERLQAELEKEKELNGLKSRFVTTVSHEFRTPLAVISTSSQILQRYHDRIPQAKQFTYLDQIQMSVMRLADLLDDTLTISKADTVGLEFGPASLDIEAFVHDLVEESRLASGATHMITLTSTGIRGSVMADPKLLRQAIMNLLSNATKYSPQASHIRVELSYEDGQLTIRVQDEGIGIPEEDQERLFEVFHRAKNVGQAPGTGLGLMIVKRAVEAHGGSITAESELGKGTTFTVSVPLVQIAETGGY